MDRSIGGLYGFIEGEERENSVVESRTISAEVPCAVVEKWPDLAMDRLLFKIEEIVHS